MAQQPVVNAAQWHNNLLLMQPKAIAKDSKWVLQYARWHVKVTMCQEIILFILLSSRDRATEPEPTE